MLASMVVLFFDLWKRNSRLNYHISFWLL
uniref:Uncharacterized protein n=1 Tax=Rhizophora mucronata TaxID=61149 RepID=A0A2P2P9P8_RHIMU